ncbi:MAG: glycogen debranching protein [Myxococcota bacterium]
MRIRTLVLIAFAALSCAKEDYTRLYRTEPKAPSLDAAEIEALAHLGAVLVDKGVNFSVYSERAERIEVLLFDDPESDRPTRQFPLHRFGDVWSIYVEGVGLGQHYGYVAWGPNWTYEEGWFPGSILGFKADVDSAGNRFNPNKLLIDPYAKALHRDHEWSKGSPASGPKRTEVDYAAAAKSLIVQSKYEWGPEEVKWRESRQDPNWVGHRWNDLILYEVHLKGFTASPASGVEHPGTYRGFAEKADYLKDLGVTAVELLPIHEKPIDGGYWGYQTLNFFAPELSYSFRKEREAVIDELKFMVEELHKRGIEVLVDVVYNHTGEGGLWRNKIEIDVSPDPAFDAQLVNFDPKEIAGLYSYRGLDNAAYYALNVDGQTYWNNTGVGNQTRPNHRPMRKLIMDSLRYYVEELHVDGFRFDLAPVLGEKDLDFNNWDDPKNTVLQEIIDDPVLQKYNTRIIAEPWSAGGWYGVKIGGFPNSTNMPGNGWYEWNGRFRDWWRAFLNDDNWKLNSTEVQDGGFLMTGSYDWYSWNGRRPYHSVNFVSVHDGFPMYDLFSYNQKQNKCGPLNPVCCEQPFSPFCDRDSGESNNRSRDWGQGAEGFKRQLMRNLFVAMMISHGTPMLYGGDEWMRTQLGNNNAYSTGADNEFNWFDWGAWEANDERHRMHDFVRQVIRFRKEHAYALAPAEYGKGAPFAWKSPQNTDQVNWGGKAVMIHYHDSTQGPELAILINMETFSVDFQLPQSRPWKRLLDTQQYFDTPAAITSAGGNPRKTGNAWLDDPTPIPGTVYGVPSRSIVVLEAR